MKKEFSIENFISIHGSENKKCKACFSIKHFSEYGNDFSLTDQKRVKCNVCTLNKIPVDILRNIEPIGEVRVCIGCREDVDLSLFEKRKDRPDDKICKICRRSGINSDNIKFKDDLKLCKDCLEYKPYDSFNVNRFNSIGYERFCKPCESKYNKKIRDSIPKDIRKKRKQGEYQKYRDKHLETCKRYRENLTKEQLAKNRVRVRAYEREKLKDPLFKLKGNIRTLIRFSLDKKEITKSSIGKGTVGILGVSVNDFKKYIESQFLPWMNWSNYGISCPETMCGWDLDHIIPISLAENEEDVLNLNHYSNFQPLCSYTNRYIKKNKNPMVCNIIKKELNKFCNE